MNYRRFSMISQLLGLWLIELFFAFEMVICGVNGDLDVLQWNLEIFATYQIVWRHRIVIIHISK